MALVFLKKASEFTLQEKEQIVSGIREAEFSYREIARIPNHTAYFFAGEAAPVSKEGLFRHRSRVAQDKIDVISLPEEYFVNPPKIVFFDMDSTVIQQEVIDELARAHGVFEEVSRVTQEAMEGKLDFASSLQKRVAYLKGLSRSTFQKVFDSLTLNPGMEELFLALPKFDCKIVILSGGFTPILELFSQKYPVFRYEANHLEEKDGTFTGNLQGRIVKAETKAQYVKEICDELKIPIARAVAVGDGANDALMLKQAGLGIGYHAKQGLKDKIEQWVDYCDLDALLFLFHEEPSSKSSN